MLNQLGSPGVRRVFWSGAKFFKLCAVVLNYVQHIFPRDASPSGFPLVTGLLTMVTWRKRLNVWRFIAIFCYAIKTNSRTIRSQVSQPASAGKGTNMSEQIKHIRTAVHSQPNSLKCKLPNRISFNVFDRCFCRVETKSCEKLRICAKRLGGLAVTILPGASRSFNPALVTPGALFTTCALLTLIKKLLWSHNDVLRGACFLWR